MESTLARLELLLRSKGPIAAAALAKELGVSQPTLSRLLSRAGDRVVRIGRARATRYALARDVGRSGCRWPLYRIDARGQAQELGELSALHGGRFHWAGQRPLPSFLHGQEFAHGVFPGLPWFLDDQRPQGFLGRAFAKRVATVLGAPADLMRWSPDDVLLALLAFGDDGPGDLVLGEHALARALAGIVSPVNVVQTDDRARAYAALAEAALAGEAVGSSAGGEQPKFTVVLEDGGSLRPLIVKFSDRTAGLAGRRWSDLLVCEHLAGETLRSAGLPAARSTVVSDPRRVYLESERFDRTPALGRVGAITLAPLDAAFYGHGRIEWSRFAHELNKDGWLTSEDARTMRVLGWFGALIANSDMHLGNLALHLADERPLPLAPAYDMLPMRYRPASTGELRDQPFQPPLPVPSERSEWLDATAMALTYWQRVAEDARIDMSLRAVAQGACEALERVVPRMS